MEVSHIWRSAIYGGQPYMEVSHIWRSVLVHVTLPVFFDFVGVVGGGMA